MFCVTSALGISWQNLNHPNLLVRSVYRFHVYFHIRLILHELGISLLHEDDSSKVKNSYIDPSQIMLFLVMNEGYRNVSTRQSYTMDNDTVQRLYKKVH